MAALFTLGKIVVPTAGVPVQIPPPVLPGAGPTRPALDAAHAITIQALPGNTGKVYIGLAGLNASTLVGVLTILPIPTANSLPAYSLSLAEAANGLGLTTLWFDVDNGGDGVLVSGIVA
jgi:hypothetical protein